MVKSKIETGRFRYIVPFEFEVEEWDFDALCDEITASEDWGLVEVKEGDPDIYEYIVDVFKKKKIRAMWDASGNIKTEMVITRF